MASRTSRGRLAGPCSRTLYRATGRDPMGLVRRRHFVSRGRELLDIEDELFDLDQLDDGFQGHGALLAALDQNRDGQLRDIVATIQGEQDEIIRDSSKARLSFKVVQEPVRQLSLCTGLRTCSTPTAFRSKDKVSSWLAQIDSSCVISNKFFQALAKLACI